MKIKFKFIDEENIQILDVDNGGVVIGRIKTPAGTCGDKLTGIQICGFDKFVEFWGCGLHGDGLRHAKKDIQLLFNSNSRPERIEIDLGDQVCPRCFYPHKECECLDMVKQLNDAANEIKNDYDIRNKNRICNTLEGKNGFKI